MRLEEDVGSPATLPLGLWASLLLQRLRRSEAHSQRLTRLLVHSYPESLERAEHVGSVNSSPVTARIPRGRRAERPDQTRPDQTRPDQTRQDKTRSIWTQARRLEEPTCSSRFLEQDAQHLPAPSPHLNSLEDPLEEGIF